MGQRFLGGAETPRRSATLLWAGSNEWCRAKVRRISLMEGALRLSYGSLDCFRLS
jgi:hypothetical protein